MLLTHCQKQDTIMQLLTSISEDGLLYAVQKLSEVASAENNNEVIYINLCIRESVHRASLTDKNRTLDDVFRRIASTIDGDTVKKKKEYLAFLSNCGINSMRLNRIENGTAQMYMNDVVRIVEKFSEPVKRYFWMNELHLCIPKMALIVASPVDFEQCFLLLEKILPPESIELLAQNESKLFKSFQLESAEENLMKLGTPPFALYSIITNQLHNLHTNVLELCEDELGITNNTWFAWRKEWIHAEAEHFSQGIPKNRLQRWQILYMAIRFDFNYDETNIFMALAGYSFQLFGDDERIYRYLTGDKKERENASEILHYLQYEHT